MRDGDEAVHGTVQYGGCPISIFILKQEDDMKKILAAILAVAMMAAAAVSVSAVGETLTAAKGTPVIDGVIDDVWATTERVQLTHLKTGSKKGDGTLPETSSAYASVLWDETAIYFLVELYDDDFAFNDGEVGGWKNDSVYLYVDELSNGGATWSDGQSQNALVPSDDLSLVPRRGTGPSDYDIKWSYPEDNHCVIEFKYVPSLIEPADMKVGFEFLADFQYNDSTEEMGRDYCFGWSDENDTASNTAAVWGKITFVEASSAATEEPAEETPAEAETPAAETPAEETPAEKEAPVVETPAETTETVETTEKAPQTFDAAVIAAGAAVAALAGYVVSKKRK